MQQHCCRIAVHFTSIMHPGLTSAARGGVLSTDKAWWYLHAPTMHTHKLIHHLVTSVRIHTGDYVLQAIDKHTPTHRSTRGHQCAYSSIQPSISSRNKELLLFLKGSVIPSRHNRFTSRNKNNLYACLYKCLLKVGKNDKYTLVNKPRQGGELTTRFPDRSVGLAPWGQSDT